MKNQPFRVVVLSGTRGTDFGAMLAESASGQLKNVEFVGFVTNRPDCLAFQRASAAGVPIIAVADSATDFHTRLLVAVKKLQPDLICLGGWMRILNMEFCEQFKNKILNVHPSLLPKYAGGRNLDVHSAVIKNGDKKTGMTIHLVTPAVDAGEIICQKEVAVADDDTPDSLREKVQALEKKWYPEVIRWFRDGKFVSEE